MLQTPASFTPLLVPQESADPLSFLFHAGRLLVRDADLALPDPEVVRSLRLDPQRLQPVGLLGGRYARAGWLDDEAQAPAGYGWRGLRSLFGELDEALVAVAGRAFQIAEWARTHRFCGVCGSGTALAAGERSFKCTNCGHTAYPRISPAMMVLVRKGDSFLLAQHAQYTVKRFVPLAGFVEAGESIEETVHREVFEEVGLRVHNLRYFGSQSWPFPHSLMIAFTADYLEGEIRTDPNEIVEARWFGPDDEWPERVPQMSISSMLVDAHRPPGR
ncbi:NAD(+) diphosphatase [Massilia sp. TN1-12]|uniref:NAD(+) diphosphatase n=1 Tax=Massilia paldalensis TaxID=3377675 RepID=UPI0038501134